MTRNKTIPIYIEIKKKKKIQIITKTIFKTEFFFKVAVIIKLQKQQKSRLPAFKTTFF